jgi:hypothetical protein
MKGFKSDASRKAAFAKMAGINKYFGKVGKYKSVKEYEGSSGIFSVPPDEMARFYDPWAIQPQTSLLMMHPELAIGPMNMESRKSKEQLKYLR